MNATTPTSELALTAYDVYYKDEVNALMIWVRDECSQWPLAEDESFYDVMTNCIISDIRDLLKNRNEEALWPDAEHLDDEVLDALVDRFLDDYDDMTALATQITNHIRENNPGLSL